MIQLLQNSLFFGGIVTLLAYEIGLLIRHKFKLAIFNPAYCSNLDHCFIKGV